MTTCERAYAEERDAADELAGFRDRFVRHDPSLIYLNGNSLGPLPVRTQARIADVVDQEWAVGLVRSWDRWLDLPGRVGDAIGEHLVGAAPGQVLVCDSVTVNLYKLARAALDGPGSSASPVARNVIVTDDDNFPTDRYALAGIAAERGAQLRLIHSDIDAGLNLAELRSALDERTALVCLSHVSYRSGALADMAAITRLVHEAGALMCWDLSHSVGSVPVELDAAGADMAVGCTYKYVNAGPGAPAFAYLRAGLQDRLHQPIWGWFGQRAQFAMGPAYDPVPGIGALAAGTPPIIGVVAVEEGTRLLGEAGLPRLRAKSVALTRYLIELADEWLAPLGFTVASPRADERRGGHVTLHHPEAERITAALAQAAVIGDYRTPDRLRLSPAPLFCRWADVYDALDRLRQLTADKAYLDLPES